MFHRAHCVPQEGGRVQGWESECWGAILQSSNVHLLNFQISNFSITNLQVSNFPNFKLRVVKFHLFKVFNFRNFKLRNFKHLGTHTFHTIHNFMFSDMKIIVVKDAPDVSCMFEILGDKYGARGSIFSRFVGRSKNVPKSIAIYQESLISHLRIMKTP